MRMLKCPRCKRQGAYLEHGQGKRRDGVLWRYRQKFCSACSYVGSPRYLAPVRVGDIRY